MDKSGELLFLVIRLALVRDLHCWWHVDWGRISISLESNKWEFSLKSLMMMIMLMMMIKFLRAINHRCIESSNLSIWVQKVDIVKMEPLGFWCMYVYHLDLEVSSSSWLKFFKVQVVSDKQQPAITVKFFFLVANNLFLVSHTYIQSLT